MNRTTKILLTVGGIVVLSYPGLAWLTGIAIEGRIQRGEQRALETTPYLVLVKRDYHRGVYRSTEVATYTLRSPALQTVLKSATGSAPLPSTITIVSNIQHGPFPGLHTPALGVIESTLMAPLRYRRSLQAGSARSRSSRPAVRSGSWAAPPST